MYQKISGSINVGGASTLITNARLRGDVITFSAGGAQYSGNVAGNTINGTVTTGGKPQSWNASR